MHQETRTEHLPLIVVKIDKNETELSDADAVVAALKQQIEEHELATFIADFDHLSHTWSLPHGQADETLLAARNLVFCFGLTIPGPEILGLRPRSIGVGETRKQFILSFLESPMPVANSAVEAWINNLSAIAEPA